MRELLQILKFCGVRPVQKTLKAVTGICIIMLERIHQLKRKEIYYYPSYCLCSLKLTNIELIIIGQGPPLEIEINFSHRSGEGKI